MENLHLKWPNFFLKWLPFPATTVEYPFKPSNTQNGNQILDLAEVAEL